jgi:LacI family transcriptional regulator
MSPTESSPKGRPSLSADKESRILELYTQSGGHRSFRSIAGEVGVAPSTVSRVVKSSGVAKPNPEKDSRKESSGTRANMRAVADRAGVSLYTASLALRNSSKVKMETRKQVEEAAKALDYRPHPYVGAQMAAVRRGRVAAVRAELAYLYADSTIPTPWHKAVTRLYGPRRRFESAKESALQAGYALEPFLFGDPEIRPRRLQQILESRGIRGLLLDFPAYLAEGRDFDFSRFNCVAFQEQTEFQPHVFTNNEFLNVLKAFCMLWRLGYRKIGFAIADSRMVSSLYRPEAAYDHCQRHLVPEHLRIPLLHEETWMKGFLRHVREGADLEDRNRIGEMEWLRSQDWNGLKQRLRGDASDVETVLEAIIGRWMEFHAPEVVICEDNHFRERLERLGYRGPEDVGLVHTNLDRDVPGWSGIRAPQEELAAAAVREVNQSIESGRFGDTANPLHVRLAGEWVEGTTTRRIDRPLTPMDGLSDRWIRRVLNESMGG